MQNTTSAARRAVRQSLPKHVPPDRLGIITLLMGLSLVCLQLGCSAKAVQLPVANEEPVAMTDDSQDESAEPALNPELEGSELEATNESAVAEPASPAATPPTNTAVATFGAGCFWCTEAVFLRLEGVTAVESGYAGGFVKNPTYEAVCEGATGHAEVCRITFDPAKVSYDELLKVFWMTHDPTTLNQQGADRGTQYRSVVFYHDDEQMALAKQYKQELDASGAFPGPIVTEISPIKAYYKAEAYHQNYFERNPFQGYCQAVVRPKIAKFEKVFKDKLKSGP